MRWSFYGSVRSTDTSAVATLIDFDFPSTSTDTDGADYSGSHAPYQDVSIPTLDTETRIFDHEGIDGLVRCVGAVAHDLRCERQGHRTRDLISA